MTADGEVDRLEVDAMGALVMTHIADVGADLARHEAVVGAWRWHDASGDRLLVSTVTPAQYIGYQQHYYRSREALPTPIAVTVPAEMKLIAGPANADLEVCWPAATALDTSTWKFPTGTSPLVLPDPMSPCALIVGAEQLDGTIPGLGRVKIRKGDPVSYGIDFSEPDDEFFALAPLAGGGFVSAYRVFAPGGVAEGLTPLGELANSVVGADATGAGLWMLTDDGDLLLLARTSKRIPHPDGLPIPKFQATPIPGGGVLVFFSATDWRTVTTDGTFTSITPLPADVRWTTRFADGTNCGDHIENVIDHYWVCYDTAGTQVTHVAQPTVPYTVPTNPSSVMLADGTLLSYFAQKLYRNDRAGITQLEAPTGIMISASSIGADGTVWGTTTSENGIETHAAQFTRDGITIVDDVLGWDAIGPQSILVDEKVFILGGERRVVRTAK